MSKIFIHYGFQSSRLPTEIEAAMLTIGIKGFIDFDKDDDGLYYMSINPVSFPDIKGYTDDELLAEISYRGIEHRVGE